MSERSQTCRNCGAELHGPYCAACGQKDVDIHVPVRELASEFVEVLPSFDKRLFRSIRPLLFDPGTLTLAYLSGKRKYYLSPFKLYVVISFLFFFTGTMRDDSEKRNTVSSMLHTDTASVSVQDSAKGWKVRSSHSDLQLSVSDSAEAAEVFGTEGISLLKKLKADPDLLFDKVKEHRSKIIFVLLPVFAFLLKLLYLRSGSLYIRHLVFSFYFHSFLFFILLVLATLEMLSLPYTGLVSFVIYLGIPVNLYSGMRKVYGQSAGKTILKLFLLSAAYALTFLLTFALAGIIIIYLFYR